MSVFRSIGACLASVLWAVCSCGGSAECVGDIQLSTWNPSGLSCSRTCDCSNLRYEGRCVSVEGKQVCLVRARVAALQKGAEETCKLLLPEGDCETGRRTAQPGPLTELLWGDCRPLPRVGENTLATCNDNKDNDCDGLTDLDDNDCKDFCRAGSAAKPCYEGPDGTLGKGTCKEGVRECLVSANAPLGKWGSCVGQVLPAQERCDPTGAKKDDDCDGQIDEDGVCCKSHETYCDFACVDLKTDAGHCGACKNSCPQQEACLDGVCSPKCKAGEQLCVDKCVSLGDTDHCGACGKKCASDERCVKADGSESYSCKGLSCESGETACAKEGVCANLQTSREHCGKCGVACAGGEVCFLGRCNGYRTVTVGGAEAFRDGSKPLFGLPTVLASDTTGRIWIADNRNYLLFSYEKSTGRVVAQNSTLGAGYVDAALLSEARFGQIAGMAYDKSREILYLSDTSHHCIRKVEVGKTGQPTTTFVGNGRTGFANGEGMNAIFSSPRDIVLDKQGNLYVVDFGNSAIRSVTPSGSVQSFLSNVKVGPLALRGDDAFLYFFNLQDEALYEMARSPSATPRKLTATGRGSVDGAFSVAQFSFPSGMVFDDEGLLYVAESLTLRKVDLQKQEVSTLAGARALGNGYADGLGTQAQFGGALKGLLWEAQDKALYVADANNALIRTVARDGMVRTILGSLRRGSIDGGLGESRVSSVQAVVEQEGVVYFSEFDVKGGTHKIRRIGKDQKMTTLAGGTGGFVDGVAATARFTFPSGLAIHSKGSAFSIFVADRFNHAIRRLEETNGVWEVSTFVGGGNGDADGRGKDAKMSEPSELAMDRSVVHPLMSLYVLDQNDKTLRKIDNEGNLSTVTRTLPSGKLLLAAHQGIVYLAGKGSFPCVSPAEYSCLVRFKSDGTKMNDLVLSGSVLDFRGMAFDAKGDLYIADSRRIVRIAALTAGASDVTVEPLQGLLLEGYVDGDASVTMFSGFAALSASLDGRSLFVFDEGNAAIRQVAR